MRLPFGAGDLDLAAERKQAGGEFGGRIGEGERAADGAAIADGGMRDVRERERDQRRMFGDLARAFGLGVAHQRADFELAVLAINAVEAGDAVDVDQQARRGQPHVERGEQALAAGEQAGFAARAEQVDGLVERARSCIGEWRRFH